MKFRRIIAAFQAAALVLLPAACSVMQGGEEQASSRGPIFDPPIRHRVELSSRRTWVLSEQSTLLVMPLDNALLDPAEAFLIQRQLQSALSTAFATVDLRVEPTHGSSMLTPERSYHYLVEAQLLGREDKRGSLVEVLDPSSTGTLGRDSLAVKLRLFQAYPRRLIDTTVVEAHSWPGLSGVSTSDLFSSAFRRYALELSALGSYQDRQMQ